MHDLGLLRGNLALVEERLRMRGLDPAVVLRDFERLDERRRARITEAETLKAERNSLSEEVGRARRAGVDAAAIMDAVRRLKGEGEALERAAAEAEEALRAVLAALPNLPQASVPPGMDERGNVEVKRWSVDGVNPEAGGRVGEAQVLGIRLGSAGSVQDDPVVQGDPSLGDGGEVEAGRAGIEQGGGARFAAKPHYELGEALGVLDLARAAKLSGARFAVFWGEGARLERALGQWMLDVQTREHGYVEVSPPLMVNSRSLFGTGQLPKFAEDLFRCADDWESGAGAGVEPGAGFDAGANAGLGVGPGASAGGASRAGFGGASEEKYPGGSGGRARSFGERDLRENDHWLIPTAEVPLTNLFRDEIVEAGELPISLAACTPCFRSEAGSYGRDVRGVIRQHQFTKVELVKFAKPEESEAAHERMTRDAESILERLELPYRRVLLCAGDMGFSAAKTYDLEVWLPGQGAYREISSVSHCEAFQARRANIRFRNSKGKAEYVHTLNGSGLAVGRAWVAVVENYQQADGTVRVPAVLQPYMGGLQVIGPRVGKR